MANLNIRVDDRLKKQAESIFSELGISMSTAMTIFLKQAVRYGGIPFDMRIDDPFFSTENQTILQESITQYNLGKTKLVTKSIDDLKAMTNE